MKEIRRRKSRQRELIFNTIKMSPAHPSALQIYDAVRRSMPSVSMGNVYRNIRILIEEGRIRSRDFGDGVEHYDAITDRHYHFICESCGAISDFAMPFREDLEEAAKHLTDGVITGHTIQFYGLCNNCKNRKKPRRTET